MMRETSLVTNMEEKNTENTRNRESPTMEPILPVSRIRGRKIFSFLKPSSTVSIMKSMARVCQSISARSVGLGGVISRETSAASRETDSIRSFLNSSAIFFIQATSQGILWEV